MISGQVAVVQRVLPEYRVSFFRRLNSRLNGCLTVVSGKDTQDQGIRIALHTEGFSHNTVTNILLPLGVTWQYGRLVRLCSKEYRVVVAEFGAGIVSNGVICLTRRVLRRSFVWWGSGFENPDAGRIRAFIRRIIMTFLTRRSDSIICYSESARSYYRELGCPEERLFVAPNAIESASRRDLPGRVAGITQRGRNQLPAVLFVGRLVPEKNVGALIRAKEILRSRGLHFKLVVVGDGPCRTELEQLAKETGEEVEFAGALYEPELLRPYFLKSSLMVLPGAGGLAMNQALSYGVPVLAATGDGTCAVLLKDGRAGRLLERGDAESIADGIEEIMENEPLRLEMARNAESVLANTASPELMTEGFLSALSFSLAAKGIP